MSRKPNILITGTPGTGKTTLCNELASKLELNSINVSEYAKENNILQDYDAQLDTYTMDEDLLIDELDEQMIGGGNILEYHSCDFFPERWFDIVFVLRTDNQLLHQRLTARNYSEEKIKNNIECEIFQVPLDEARSSYDENIVHELASNEEEDMERNIEQITTWYRMNA